MAYIHKVSLCVVDEEEIYSNGNGLIEDLFSVSDDTYPIEKTIESETRSFDWHDDVVVNKVDCTKEEADSFFKSLLKVDAIKQSILNDPAIPAQDSIVMCKDCIWKHINTDNKWTCQHPGGFVASCAPCFGCLAGDLPRKRRHNHA